MVRINRLSGEMERIKHIKAKNDLVNPVNVLKRGYSMTLHQGKIISGIGAVTEGETLETRVYDGTILSKVEKTIKSDDKRED